MTDCPGAYKCHGCTIWCDVCGDTSQTCDDINCSVHLRRDEIVCGLWKAEAEFQYHESKSKEAAAEVRAFSKMIEDVNMSRARFIVPRSFSDHDFESLSDFPQLHFAVCKKCGQIWDRKNETAILKPCHEFIVSCVIET